MENIHQNLEKHISSTNIYQFSFLRLYTKTEPEWASIRLTRINNDAVDKNSSILALIRHLELFAAKPFTSKEEMTNEDKLKWKKNKSSTVIQQYIIARLQENNDFESSEDTENDEGSL